MDEVIIKNYDSFVVWKDGEPEVKFREMLTKNVAAELPLAAVSSPYKRTEKEIFLGIDSEFEGKSNIEVMNIRLARKAAAGDMDAIKLLNDRILGKPKQQIESTRVSMTYQDYLDQITEEENAGIVEADVNDL